ncbi:MAG: sigma factor [Patescibacteria group bacterium]
MASQDVSTYLQFFDCSFPTSVAERKTLQAKLFAAMRYSTNRIVREAARNRLHGMHAKLILDIASKIAVHSEGANIEDLMQEGHIALGHAMETFDPRRNVLLATYAKLGLRQAMERSISVGLDGESPVYIPGFRMRQINKVKFAMGQLDKERRPIGDVKAILAKVHARSEKSSHMKTKEDVERCLQIIRENVIELNAPVKDDDPSGTYAEIFIETQTGDRENLEKQYANAIADIIKGLDRLAEELNGQRNAKRDMLIIKLRLGFEGPTTLRTVGKRHAVTRSRIQQIEAEMFERLSRYTNLSVDQIKGTAKLANLRSTPLSHAA